MKILEIKSVSEYVKTVCDSNNEILSLDPGATLLFRGQPNMQDVLLPSLGRIGANSCALITEESNMVEMAKYKLPTVFRRDLEPIELLALLQHHGIPTRLLDVSANALVALYFAVHGKEEDREDDGEVLVFKTSDIDISNYGMINTICDSYRHGKEHSRQELESLYEFCKNPIFAYAPSYSLRQNIQSGRYILFANKIVYEDGEYRMEDEIEPISKEHDSVVCRLIIPSHVKEEICKDLRLLGVSKELLFLDNTDMVCGEIRDRYSERISKNTAN